MGLIDTDTFVKNVVKSGFGVEFINRVTALLIDTPKLEIWDITGNGMQDLQVMMLGYIRGITELAEALKEVLKA